jgi:hypothetical protein
MRELYLSEKLKIILQSKKEILNTRLFVTREDGIMLFDSVMDASSSSVSALVSGVWQAASALMNIVQPDTNEALMYRFGFDTSASGIILLPLEIEGKNYYLGAIYKDCLNPGFLKRQVTLIKEEIIRISEITPEKKALKSENHLRHGFLFDEITDAEMDQLFSIKEI